jgi:para-aminobenzoate synthetase/4-amino-4-deoxychorismate lyase
MQPIDVAATTPKSVLLVTSRVANESRQSYLFTNPHHVFIAHTYDDLPALFREIDAAPGNGLYAAGYLGYECGYGIEPSLLAIAPAESSVPLAWFGFYQDAIKFNYKSEPRHFAPPLPTLDISKDEYFDKFAKIKSHIKAGNTYQVNLTTRLKFNTPDLSALFTHLMAVQPVEFGAFINLDGIHVLSASPELFFRRCGTHIVTRPMKGTAPRGFSIAEQNENARWLANDEKNQSENVMIVDLLDNSVRKLRMPTYSPLCFPAVQLLELPKFERCKLYGTLRRILAMSTLVRLDSLLLMMKRFSMSLFAQLYHKRGNARWELEVELSGILTHRRNMTNVDSKARF